ncbi:MAG TPA: hypothetical protein VFE61_02630 [Candidatus Sulfotelmatobacter sp.]|jgi:hypothetical protein|nr:hypothetical protein [Candidatus Sulfotelmatobacter sp.]
MSHSVKHSFATVLASLLCAAVIAMAALAIASSVAFGQKPAQAKATQSLPPGPLQAKATTSCLECHEARIILQQRLSKSAWTKEVDKMIKWGAVVDASDHDALIDYLSTNFGVDQPPYEPVRTTSEGSRAGKKSK